MKKLIFLILGSLLVSSSFAFNIDKSVDDLFKKDDLYFKELEKSINLSIEEKINKSIKNFFSNFENILEIL